MNSEEHRTIDGFYIGYFTASAGQGVATFVLSRGILVGADIGGVIFDGFYKENKENRLFEGIVKVSIPGGANLIQGYTAPSAGIMYEVPLNLPTNFEQEPFFQIRTALGPVNCRLIKIREIPNNG